jgi:hypothetical protein
VAAPRRSPACARAALEALDRGWSVVPLHTATGGRCSCGDSDCPAPGKHARVRWKSYMELRAGRDQVVRWWRRWPGANVGIVTGAVSGLVVLDVDPRHGGEDTLAELEARNGALPRTVEALTGGGGQHLYFRHPGVRVPSRPVAPGLDVKGEGGIVVGPPSVHVSGRPYVWEHGCSPEELVPADAPPWIAAMASAAAPAEHGARPDANPARTAGERAEFATLWRRVGIELRPGDHNYLCPFHPDRHPSLHIDADGCRFYCFGCARGGGSGRLRRLVDRPGRRPRRAAGEEPMAPRTEQEAVTLPGSTVVRVVGESAFQDALLELTGGRRHYGGVHMGAVAHLVLEPGNPVDPQAIAVRIAGRTVGYLSRADGARFRPWVLDAAQRLGEASAAATIVGGWEREHGETGYFGVRLTLGSPLRSAPAVER